MVYVFHAGVTTIFTKFKRNLMGAMVAGNGESAPSLKRNQPVFYCVPAVMYGAMPAQIANCFKGAGAKRTTQLFESLAAMVQAERMEGERYAA